MAHQNTPSAPDQAPSFKILEAIVANQLKKFVHPRVRNMHENTFTRMEAGAFIKPTVTQQSGFS